MQVNLKVASGKNAGKIIAVKGREFVIGRNPDCHLRPKSDLISPRHCRVSLSADGVKVEDFGSENGTFVNASRIEDEQELASGDHLKVGPLEFEVLIEYEIGGKKRKKVNSIMDVAARTAEKSPDREGDIADWLDDDDDDDGDQGETATFSLDEIKVVKSQEEIEAEQEEAEKKGKKGSGKEKKVYGKLPKSESESGSAEDTRQAADEMLRQMFKK